MKAQGLGAYKHILLLEDPGRVRQVFLRIRAGPTSGKAIQASERRWEELGQFRLGQAMARLTWAVPRSDEVLKPLDRTIRCSHDTTIDKSERG
ncbi:hypothetical protein EAO76_02490 [Streptomyces sp. sk2.1]|nr:hypothetical protein EAO76_02490 [Streptomyces sp. sk2.1]